MEGFLCLVCLLALMSIYESDIIVKQRVINARMKTYYKRSGLTYDLNSARDWCHGLGGQLPIILTQDELDFLAVTVIVKDDYAGTSNRATWMGLKREKGHCLNCLNRTPVNMTFNYSIASHTCESCTASCCAMIMWNDDNHKKIDFRDCKELAKAVCVFDEEKTVVLPEAIASLTKLYGELNGSLKDLSQKTQNNFDQVSQFQSLTMKEHNESKKMLDETRRQLNETENQLKKLQTWIDDHVNIKSETIKEIDGLKKSSSTTNILHWTTLGIMTCLIVIIVIIGIIGFRRRHTSVPVLRENNVAYVAGEEKLNFSSAGPSSFY